METEKKGLAQLKLAEISRHFLCFIQSRSFARVWNTHFIILSFRVRDSFPEEFY